jgi:predicted acetyltransferase/predicted enzyme related to lactoylglutathione lyase
MKEHAEAFKESFLKAGEHIYGSCGFIKFNVYEEWLSYIDRVSNGLQEGRLPSSTFFAVESGTGEIVGITDVRHVLNGEHYSNGHIGYSVRPDRRRMGYGAEILRQGLEIAARLGIDRVMVSCRKDNAGSRGVILRNGGVWEYEFTDDGIPCDMYGINLRQNASMKFAGICLVTRRVRALAEFYENVLGAKAEGDDTHMQINAAGLSLAVFSKEGMEGMAPGSTKDAGPGGFTFGFTVGDVDAEFERVKALGTEILMPPTTHPWGWRSFFCKDPDGNVMVFNCPTKDGGR